MRLSTEKLKTHLNYLVNYTSQLKAYRDFFDSEEKFTKDEIAHYAVERLFQLSIESCINMGNHLTSAWGLKKPDENRDIFKILGESRYLDKDYADVMVKIVKFRNRLVHIYWEVGLSELYGYLQKDIEYLDRFREFIVGVIDKEEAG